jgi:hypothetical protein
MTGESSFLGCVPHAHNCCISKSLYCQVVGSIALTIINCLLTRYGSGRHIETLTSYDISIQVELGFVARILYQFTLMSTKLAVCAFYLRVFTDRVSKRVIWSMAAVITIFSIPLLLSLIFRCNPIEGTTPSLSLFLPCLHIIGAWSLTPSKCVSNIPPLYASAVLNILADVALLAFVIPKIGEPTFLSHSTQTKTDDNFQPASISPKSKS